MDALITAAARALMAGDALGALKRVSLREDPPALALRGIAMAQLGEYPRARELLRSAARGFGAHEALSRARCLVADAEVALALRELGGSPRLLAEASRVLEAHADRANALHARLIAVRRLLLLGRIDAAAAELSDLNAGGLPPSLRAVAALAAAEVALRSLRTAAAQAALGRARAAAEEARVPALVAEVAQARAALDHPAARQVGAGAEQPLRLHEVEALLASGALVLDACRRGLRAGDAWLPLARRPILFTLAQALAEAWPGDADRDALIARAFRTRHPDDTHRARLRVEIGRLRALAAPLARIEATARGFALRPRPARRCANAGSGEDELPSDDVATAIARTTARGVALAPRPARRCANAGSGEDELPSDDAATAIAQTTARGVALAPRPGERGTGPTPGEEGRPAEDASIWGKDARRLDDPSTAPARPGERRVVVLLPPIDGDDASLLALLADGAAWSTSALALALGSSQRTVQRALAELEAAGRVRSIGRARAQRWLSPPLARFTTILLLPAALPLA